MKYVLLCLLATAFVHTQCHADTTTLNPDIRQRLFETSQFHEVRSRAHLPPGVMALCADSTGRIADPGEAWQIGCVGDDSTPKTRLIWAAIAGRLYVVHYESGGIVHSFHLLVATLEEGDTRATVEWRSVVKFFKNYGELVAALKSNRLEAR
jgi:hypothetical protein